MDRFRIELVLERSDGSHCTLNSEGCCGDKMAYIYSGGGLSVTMLFNVDKVPPKKMFARLNLEEVEDE